MVDHSPTMLAYFDSGLICRYCNASYRRVFERQGQSLEGAHFESLVQPDKRDTVLPHAHAAMAGDPQDYEYERATPDGRRIHVEVKYTPDVRDGIVVGMFVELHDITSHKQIEGLVLETNRDLEMRVQERNDRLFESEQRFRLMVDGLKDYCIYFLDELGYITDWTDSAQRLHNVAAPKVLRQHISVLLDDSHPGQHPPVLAQLVRLANETGQSEFDGWQSRQGEPAFWAHTTFTALRDADANLLGLSVITKDMTAQKRLEEVMSNLNQVLEKRVQDRNRELMVANRDIDALSHMVSHDLRAPLRHISGYLTLLQEDLAPHQLTLSGTPVMQHIAALDQTSKRLSRMIESALEYARLGRTTLSPSAVSLTHVVHKAVQQARASSGSRQVELSYPGDWPMVRGDASLLDKLMGHILSNALKYTSKRPIARIELGWRDSQPNDPQPSGHEHPDRMVTLWVKDNGAGFDSQQAQNLYVMFQRQHHTMDFEGTGTGLALSQRIARLHGGAFNIRSQQDQGCLVTVTLPMADHVTSA